VLDERGHAGQKGGGGGDYADNHDEDGGHQRGQRVVALTEIALTAVRYIPQGP